MSEDYFLTERAVKMLQQQRNVFYQTPGIKELFYKENEMLLKNIDQDSVVLDVGCGLGTHLTLLSKYCKEAHGIDHSDAILKKGKKIVEQFSNVRVAKMNAYNIDYPDNFFDQACCMFNTFGNMKDEKAVLNEMCRVTKKGGHVIFSVFNMESIPERIEFYQKTTLDDAHAEGTVIRSGEIFFSRTYSEDDIRKICKTAGLEPTIHRTRIAYVCDAVKRKKEEQ